MDARSTKPSEPILDFDTVTDSRDPMAERLSIAPESERVVAATFFRGELEHVVRYVFAREDGAWRVDDIGGGEGDGKWDLREIVKPGAEQRRLKPPRPQPAPAQRSPLGSRRVARGVGEPALRRPKRRK